MANINFTKTIMGGRFTADPELKTTQSGTFVTSFTIAVNRRTKEGAEAKTDFFSCTAWRQTAEFITKFFRKGSSIVLVGSNQNRSFKGSDGVERVVTELVVDEAFFADSRAEAPAAVQTATTERNAAPAYDDDDILPF